MKEILLTQGQVALVDDQDFEWLLKYKWYAQWNTDTCSYGAARSIRENGKKKTVLMHRAIMNARPNQQVDHRNHNTLDNRRENLRLCTHGENQHNQRPQIGCSSKYKGVSWHKARNKWVVYIHLNDQQFHLGCFADEVEAAHVYDDAAHKMFGEFAFTNFQG
jgi:hypothetical protein